MCTLLELLTRHYCLIVSNLHSDELHYLKNMCLVSQATEGPDLDFDIDIPLWNGVDTSSSCTGTETCVDVCVNMVITF